MLSNLLSLSKSTVMLSKIYVVYIISTLKTTKIFLSSRYSFSVGLSVRDGGKQLKVGWQNDCYVCKHTTPRGSGDMLTQEIDALRLLLRHL